MKLLPRMLATGVAVAMLLPAAAWAGDDVDYSAPYLVVEDGQLVTKYPNREHEGGAAASSAVEAASADPATANDAEGAPWLVAALVGAGAVAALLVALRFRSRA